MLIEEVGCIKEFIERVDTKKPIHYKAISEPAEMVYGFPLAWIAGIEVTGLDAVDGHVLKTIAYKIMKAEDAKEHDNVLDAYNEFARKTIEEIKKEFEKHLGVEMTPGEWYYG